MASLQEIILTGVSTIHTIINQVQINERIKLKMLIDNTKFLLFTSKKLLGEEKYEELKSKLKKAEDVLFSFDKISDDEIKGNINTYMELQSKVQEKMKEREKYIIDTCLEIMSAILDNCEGLIWQ